jgi:hypothetical protein
MRNGASWSTGVGGAVFLNEMSKPTWPERIGSGMRVSVAVVSPLVASERLSELSASVQGYSILNFHSSGNCPAITAAETTCNRKLIDSFFNGLVGSVRHKIADSGWKCGR